MTRMVNLLSPVLANFLLLISNVTIGEAAKPAASSGKPTKVLLESVSALPYRNSRAEVGHVLGSGGFGSVATINDDPDVVVKLAVVEHKGNVMELLKEKSTMDNFKQFSLVPRALDLRFLHLDKQRQPVGLMYMERCHLDLSTVRKEKIYFTFEEILGLFFDYTVSMAYIHGTGIAHNDIKPGNMFISRGGWGLMGDFGLSTSAVKTPFLSGFKGTYQNAPPEKMATWLGRNMRGKYPLTSYPAVPGDIWGLASVMYQVCTSSFLGPALKKSQGWTREALYFLEQADYDWYLDTYIPQVHRCRPLVKYFKRMLAIEPFERPSFLQLVGDLVADYPHLADTRQWQVCPKVIPGKNDSWRAHHQPHALRAAGRSQASSTDDLGLDEGSDQARSSSWADEEDFDLDSVGEANHVEAGEIYPGRVLQCGFNKDFDAAKAAQSEVGDVSNVQEVCQWVKPKRATNGNKNAAPPPVPSPVIEGGEKSEDVPHVSSDDDEEEDDENFDAAPYGEVRLLRSDPLFAWWLLPKVKRAEESRLRKGLPALTHVGEDHPVVDDFDDDFPEEFDTSFTLERFTDLVRAMDARQHRFAAMHAAAAKGADGL